MIDKAIDYLIAIALIVGVATYFSGSEFELEMESELDPIEAKINHYCSLTEYSDSIPLNIREACKARKAKTTPDDEDIERIIPNKTGHTV